MEVSSKSYGTDYSYGNKWTTWNPVRSINYDCYTEYHLWNRYPVVKLETVPTSDSLIPIGVSMKYGSTDCGGGVAGGVCVCVCLGTCSSDPLEGLTVTKKVQKSVITTLLIHDRQL